jgi:hypothetical protein
MSKKETLCNWKKEEIKDSVAELRKILHSPEYYCRKCARASSDERYLCKPEKL